MSHSIKKEAQSKPAVREIRLERRHLFWGVVGATVLAVVMFTTLFIHGAILSNRW